MESETSPLFQRMSMEAGRPALADCLAAMGCTSVFDIVRQPKAQFEAALQRQDGAGDWNAEEIYDNAVGYAIQLYRSFLEHELHRDDGAPAPFRSGVKGLIEQRPDYPTLFKENWGAFCRAGAFESRYGPAAYLCDLYREATEVFESAAGRNASDRILLSQRRPDLAAMVIDPGAMNASMPMLTLVNEILVAAIEDYRERQEPDDPRTLHEVFAERQYPLNFPYHQPHHKVRLTLEARRLTLGGLQLLVQPLDRRLYDEGRFDVAATALCFCNGLSPPQQHMLVLPPPFAMFNLTMSDLADEAFWAGPRLAALMIDLPPDGKPFAEARSTASLYLVHKQDGIVEGSNEPVTANPGPAVLSFPDADAAEITLEGRWYAEGHTLERRMDYLPPTWIDDERRTRLRLYRLGDLRDYSTRFTVAPFIGEGRSVGFGEIVAGFDIALHLSEDSPDDFSLTSEQQLYLHDVLGAIPASGRNNPFERVDTLLSRLGIDTETLDRLLARGEHAPTVSPHLSLPPLLRDGGTYEAAVSAPYQYGAVYVHGGMPEAMNIEDRSSNPDSPDWRLTELTPDRLDRLQRMVRLGRWTGLTYEELDGLLTSASRAEVRRRATMPESSSIPITSTLSWAAMRVLGGFRYFHDKYGIPAGDFSAYLDGIAVHGLGARPSLFDRWFNPVPFSQEPFVLDHSELPVSLDDEDIDAKQLAAVRRLCAALGMLPVEASYGVVARAVHDAMSAAETPLTLSRKVVSAFFRICRAARMFGMDATELLALLGLLGDGHAASAIAPHLRAVDAPSEADTLDVWLEVSAVADWLAENQWKVATLMHLLHRDGGRLAADNNLLQFVRAVASNLASAVVNRAWLVHPDLPTDIDWTAVLRTVLVDGKPLIDEHGLVMTLALMPQAEQMAWLVESLQPLQSVEPPLLEEEALAKAIVALAERVLAASHAQERALSVALNQTLAVPDEVAPLVVRWAGRDGAAAEAWTIAEFLAETLALAASGEMRLEDVGTPYLDKLYAVRRHALAREVTAMSAQALYTLLRHADRFGLADSRLSIDALYLLTRYRDWRKDASVHEDVLLAYLASSDDHDVDLLASLLDWTPDELAWVIDDTTAARTWRSLNTLLCRKAASEQGGLPAATLASLLALDLQDDWATWSAAGDTALAAVSG